MADKKTDTGKLPDKEVKATEASPKASPSKGEYRGANIKYMKGMYPDSEINDDNYGEMMDKTMAEHFRPRMESYDKANGNLKAMMASEPKLSMILGDMAKGAKFEEVLPRYIDTPNLKLEPGDPDYSKWEENNKHRQTTHKESMDRKTQTENNQKMSQQTISKWFDEQKMDEGKRTEYGAFVAETMDRAYSGEITPEFLNKMKYAMDYKDDVAAAAEMGEIKGKNTKIVEEKMTDEKKSTGDGVPSVEGGAIMDEKEKVDNSNPLEKGLKSMVKKKSILSGNNY